MKVFVASSGRCGTGFLASGFKKYTNFAVFHEQPPVIVDSLLDEANRKGTDSETLKRKCAKIAEHDNYVDTGHQFMRGFSDYVLEAFDSIKVIKLVRDPLEVARSRIHRNVIPGKTPWLGKYDDDKNVIRLTVDEWEELTDLQKILLDWLEHEERFDRAQDKFDTVVFVSFFALTNNTGDTFKRIFKTLGIEKYEVDNLDGLFRNANLRRSVVQPSDQKEYDDLLALVRSRGYPLAWLDTGFYQRVAVRHDVYQGEIDLLPHYEKHVAYSSLDPEWAFKHLPAGKLRGKRVLDLGCGDGRFSKYLREKLGCTVVGVDFSSRRISSARKKCPGIAFFCANAYTFVQSYKGPRFDYVLMTEFMEHLENPEALMSGLRKIADGVLGTVPKNFPYVAHLQVYRTAKEFRERFLDWPIKTKLGPTGSGVTKKNTIYFYT